MVNKKDIGLLLNYRYIYAESCVKDAICEKIVVKL